MDTYTIAEAARLVGTSRGKLYQAIRTGQLQTAPGEEPGQAMTLTRAALRAAGFPVPEPEAPDPPHATGQGPPPGQDPPGPMAAGLPDRERQSDQGDRALIAHLERALEEARERERRLLDLVAHLTGQRSAPPAAAPPASPPPPAAPRRGGPAAPERPAPADRRGGAPASGGPRASGCTDPAAHGQRPAGHHEGHGAERHPHAARGRPVCRGPRLVRGHAARYPLIPVSACKCQGGPWDTSPACRSEPPGGVRARSAAPSSDLRAGTTPMAGCTAQCGEI